MKRNIIAIMMVMVALLATQCKKSAEPLANEPAGETMEVTVRVENNTAKTDITATGVVTWKQGDKLYVVGETQGLLGYVSAVADGDPAKFEGKITALTSAQVLRFYYVGDKDFTLDGSGNYTFNLGSQDGTLAGIAAHSQLMFGKTSEGVAVGTTDFGAITMTSLMAIAHLNITGNTSNTVTVKGGFATSTFNAKTYDGETLTGTAGNITMTSASAIGECYLALLPGTQTLTFANNEGTASLSAKDVVANMFYNSESAIEVTMTLPEGALPGLFSVSATKQVYFSKGNLQYIGSAATPYWKFADHQFDFIGNGQNGSDASNIDRDLFGWGTSGYHQSTDSYNVNYQPWATSTSTVNGTYNNYGYGPSTNVTPEGPSGMTQSQGNISGSYYDWGVNCAISNGGNQAGKWRTLTGNTGGEWYYLLNTRTMKYGKPRYTNKSGGINIGGTTYKGLFIYPDDYNGTEVGADATTGTWDKINGLGIVFLPVAGYRDGASVSNVGSCGCYWSSSYFDSDDAYHLVFFGGDVLPSNRNDRYRGYSVRLVSEN